MDPSSYVKLLRTAQRLSRRHDEAEDLLQSVLLAAVNAGRTDLACANNRNWLIGALKKRAAFDARSAIRRQQRDASYLATTGASSASIAFPTEFVNTLPPALRTTTLLVLTGHNRREIAWLLRLSDAALRQRLKVIRQRWRQNDRDGFAEMPGLSSNLAFGRLRKSMLNALHRKDTMLASHDPDGHLFMVSSQNRASRQLPSTPQPIAE